VMEDGESMNRLINESRALHTSNFMCTCSARERARDYRDSRLATGDIQYLLATGSTTDCIDASIGSILASPTID